MSKIKVMNELLANKIAAGEVIEKLASIVKELTENSIDAGASKIVIELLNAGMDDIIVTDDGEGMDSIDAKECFLRHATSKIYKEDDLYFIDTLGFRGEALASIASVSEIELKTCNGKESTYIHLKGGVIDKVEPCEERKGTSISVTNVFYNTPARLKYLKSEASELASITNFVEKLALSEKSIAFTLTNNGKEIVKTSGSGNMLKVIHEIYGANISSNMLEIKNSNNDFTIYGYACKPHILKSTKNHMITFINNRVIKNYDINEAINDAYYTYKPEGKFPVVVLNIETDPTVVDVNIHPTKQDVKISKIKDLKELITSTIKKALYESLLIIKPLEDEKTEENNYEHLQLNNKINDYMNKTSRTIIDYCINNDIGTLVVGYNETFQKNSNIGKANNQTFVNIPYGQLRFKLEYLCEINGIVFVKQEESYTSKASFWDKDDIPIYNNDNPQSYTFSGKRIHRGMYQCLNGKCLNADVNGALNILRKSNVVSLVGLYSRGEVDTPVRIRIA